MRARLVQRREDNRGLAPEIANYAVDTWSYALGVGLGRSSDRVQDVPAAYVNGLATGASAAERAAADRPAGSLPAAAPVVVKATMSNQNKALVGGVGLLAVAAVAFALLHHPVPTPPPAGNVPDVQHGHNPQNPTPPGPNVQNPQTRQNNPPPAPDGQTKTN